MITIVINQDDKRIQDLMAAMLAREGYTFKSTQGDSNLTSDIVNIVQKDSVAQNLLAIKDKIIELENTLYNERKGVLYRFILEAVERPLIEYVLKRTEGNQLKAAKILGINRNTMRSKVKKLGINVGEYKS